MLLLGLDLLARSLKGWNPPGDEVAYGFGLLMLVTLAGLAEVLALAFGVAGTLQRQRKRIFAALGVVCSALVLSVVLAQVDVSALIAVFLEPQPEVRTVSP